MTRERPQLHVTAVDMFANLLRSIGACAEARAWARGKTLAEAWAACEQPDWMAWLAVRMADEPGWPTRRQVALAAAACAETVLPFAAEAEPAARAAIEAVRRLAAGEASTADVRAAAIARGRGVSRDQARRAVADVLRTLPIPALETKP